MRLGSLANEKVATNHELHLAKERSSVGTSSSRLQVSTAVTPYCSKQNFRPLVSFGQLTPLMVTQESY